MKTFKLITLLALVSFGALSFSAGCASTATRESTGKHVADSTITTKVKAQLVHDKSVSAFDVNVKTLKGVVQLSGLVNTPDEKARAADDAARVAGVIRVENYIGII